MRSFALLGLLVLGLLVAGCGDTSQKVNTDAATRTAAGIPGSTATPGFPSLPPPGLIFQSLRMFTKTTGWAQTQTQVFHTSDGATHWENVTPKPPGLPAAGVLNLDSSYFLSATQAWVALSMGEGKPELIFRTNDGGTAWLQVQVQASHISAITFLDTRYGWMIDSHAGAAGAEGADVYRTADGGTTWNRVASAAPNTTGALPLAGHKIGLSFVSATTGWVTGADPQNNALWCYKTQDGGATWKQQALPVPAGISGAQFTLNPPTFFDGRRGVMSAGYTASGALGVVFYVTQNGGQSWTVSSPTPGSASVTNQLDTLHLWATDGSLLFASRDGGQHWETMIARDNFKNVSTLNFVSLQVGFALSVKDGSAYVLKTTDGGQTWAVVPPAR
jgi:photosystem II stability/assembly factor-like uncharacterized protein